MRGTRSRPVKLPDRNLYILAARCPFRMTTTKHTPFESKLDQLLRSIHSDVREIRGIVAGSYEKLRELADTADAVYRTVSYNEPNGTISAPLSAEEWDFLDEEE